MAADVAPARPRLPDTKQACQRVLRRLGHAGYKIDAIEQPVDGVGRVYVLSGRQWVGPDQWRRDAKTILFFFADDEVATAVLDGWQVAEAIPTHVGRRD